MGFLGQLFIIYAILLVSLVIHEAAHALFAKLGGDMTAYTGGQVSLNPVPHIKREPFGTVILPWMMLIIGYTSGKGLLCMGYAHIPVDPIWAYTHPKRAALMSAAGPLSNLLLAAIAFLAMKGLLGAEIVRISDHDPVPVVLPPYGEGEGLFRIGCQALSFLLILNLLLFTINLIPVPPLDGAGVIEGVFPNSLGRIIRELKRQPIVILIVMIGLLFSIMAIMMPIYRTVRGWL
ncbi:MAG: site-2 protease family protein [Planctomycetota bacterium]